MNNNEPNCESFCEQISLMAAGCLSPVEERELRAHLDSCGSCHERFDRLATICSSLSAAKPEIDEASLITIQQCSKDPAVLGRKNSESTIWRPQMGVATLAALAAAILIAVGFSYLLSTETDNFNQVASENQEAPEWEFAELPVSNAKEMTEALASAATSEEFDQLLVGYFETQQYQPLNKHYRFEELF